MKDTLSFEKGSREEAIHELHRLVKASAALAENIDRQGQVNYYMERLESFGLATTVEGLIGLGFSREEAEIIRAARTLYEKRVH